MRKRDGRCSVRFASVLSVLTLLAAGLVLPTGSAGAAQPSGTPIKIGYLMTKTGPTDIDNEPSFAAAVKWINAHGGVAGHPVTLISDFESGDVAVSVADAKKLIGDGVDAMVDSDANDSAWASIPEKAGVPVFLSADTLAFAGSDDAFGAPQVVTVTTPLIMLAAKKFGGADKLAVLYCTEYSQCSQAVPYYSSIGKKYDVHVVYSAAASQSAPNYLAQCLAAKAAGANSLFVASSADVAMRVVKDCAKQGYTPHLLAGSGSYQKSFAGSPGTNGMIVSDQNVPFFDTNVPAIKTMTEAFDKYDPAITRSSNYDDSAVWNWIIGALLLGAGKAANWTPNTQITPAALRSALFTLHTTTAGGLMNQVTFSEGKPQTNNCSYTVTIKNNKLVLPYGLKATCITTS